MIRYKEKEFQQWSICPATGDIFDSSTGEIQPVKLRRGRPMFKGMLVHQIMANTFYGFKPGYDVHHKDENTLNNSLSNLVYLSKSEHRRLHATELFHEETRVKLSASNKGKKRKPFSEEHKAKISAAMKGKPKSEEAKMKLSAVMKGKHLSEEHKAKISSFQKGRPKSEETKAKISASKKGKTSLLKGKPRSAETRTKISEAMRRKHAGNISTNLS